MTIGQHCQVGCKRREGDVSGGAIAGDFGKGVFGPLEVRVCHS